LGYISLYGYYTGISTTRFTQFLTRDKPFFYTGLFKDALAFGDFLGH
jgi:hypothetical protein